MDHTIALIQKSHEGDEEARAQIVEENTGLVWCIVRSIDKFDLGYDVKFSTYAVPIE